MQNFGSEAASNSRASFLVAPKREKPLTNEFFCAILIGTECPRKVKTK